MRRTIRFSVHHRNLLTPKKEKPAKRTYRKPDDSANTEQTSDGTNPEKGESLGRLKVSTRKRERKNRIIRQKH